MACRALVSCGFMRLFVPHSHRSKTSAATGTLALTQQQAQVLTTESIPSSVTASAGTVKGEGPFARPCGPVLAAPDSVRQTRQTETDHYDRVAAATASRRHEV